MNDIENCIVFAEHLAAALVVAADSADSASREHILHLMALMVRVVETDLRQMNGGDDGDE